MNHVLLTGPGLASYAFDRAWLAKTVLGGALWWRRTLWMLCAIPT